MNDFGFVQLPIEEYNRLYDASKELESLKTNLVKVGLDYHKEPQIQTSIPKEMIVAAWDKVKDQYPEYVCDVRSDEDSTIYSGIKKKEPPTPELNLDLNEGDK